MKEQESIIYMSGTIKVCMDHLFYWFILLLIIYYIYVDHKETVLPAISKQDKSTNHSILNGGHVHSPTIKGSVSRDIWGHI
jgi:hypothetical protein